MKIICGIYLEIKMKFTTRYDTTLFEAPLYGHCYSAKKSNYRATVKCSHTSSPLLYHLQCDAICWPVVS